MFRHLHGWHHQVVIPYVYSLEAIVARGKENEGKFFYQNSTFFDLEAGMWSSPGPSGDLT